jgi:hypothetical protein
MVRLSFPIDTVREVGPTGVDLGGIKMGACRVRIKPASTYAGDGVGISVVLIFVNRVRRTRGGVVGQLWCLEQVAVFVLSMLDAARRRVKL